MRKISSIKLTRLWLTLGAVFSIVGGQGSSAVADVRETTKTLEKVIGRVQERTLSNGIRVTLYKRGDAPVFAGVVAARVGGVDEVPGETGIAHMLEHMAFKGTSRLGTKDYEKEKKLLVEQENLETTQTERKLTEVEEKRLREVEAQLQLLWSGEGYSREIEKRGGAGLNATTAKEITQYFVSLPRSAFEYWCWIESERILDPVFRQFYKERDVVLEERRMRYENDPGGKLYETLLGVAFLSHPYRNPVIGYEADVRGLTARKLQEFQSKYYVGKNLAVSIVGDVDLEKDGAVLEKYFGRIPSGPPPERTSLVEEPQSGERTVKVKFEASPQFLIAYHKPSFPHPDDPKLGVLEQILAGGRTSPLVRELVVERQLATDVSIEEAPGNASPNLLLVSITPRAPHSNEEVLREFDLLLRRILTKGFTQEEVERAKRALAVSFLSELSHNQSLASNFASQHLLFNNWHASLDWYKLAVGVSGEELQQLGLKYLVPSSRTIAFLIPSSVKPKGKEA